MNHNDFNLDEDFLIPIKNFIKRFTRIKNHKFVPEMYSIIPDSNEDVINKSEIISKEGFMNLPVKLNIQ